MYDDDDDIEESAEDVAMDVFENYLYTRLAFAAVLISIIILCTVTLLVLTFASMAYLPGEMAVILAFVVCVDIGWRSKRAHEGRSKRKREAERCLTEGELVEHHLDVLAAERKRMVSTQSLSHCIREPWWWWNQTVLTLYAVAAVITITAWSDSLVMALTAVITLRAIGKIAQKRLDKLGVHVIDTTTFADPRPPRDSPEV